MGELLLLIFIIFFLCRRDYAFDYRHIVNHPYRDAKAEAEQEIWTLVEVLEFKM